MLAGFNIYTRDANVAVTPDLAAEHTAAAQLAPGYSLWPFLMAFGGVTVVVGLVTYQAIFIIGTILLLAAGGEWMAQAWAERASADDVHNASVRSRMANPFEFPIAGVVAIGIIVYSFSRIMLWLSKTNTVLAFGVLAAIFLAFAFLFAYRPSIKSRAMISIIAIGAVGLVAGGAAAGIDGEREIHPHETTEELAPARASARTPTTPKPTRRHRRTSPRSPASPPGSRSTTTARCRTTSTGRTREGEDGTITLPRSSPNNVLFINDSDEDRRLSVDMGTIVVAGEDGDEVEAPAQACTTLVEPGGEQLITLNIAQPSFAFPDGFRFFVPGVETAELGLVVP